MTISVHPHGASNLPIECIPPLSPTRKMKTTQGFERKTALHWSLKDSYSLQLLQSLLPLPWACGLTDPRRVEPQPSADASS